jgi:class 3 adenylate cyclase
MSNFGELVRRLWWIFALAALGSGVFVGATARFHWLALLLGGLMGANISLVLAFYTDVVQPRIVRSLPMGAALLVNGASYVVVIYALATLWIIALQVGLHPGRAAEVLANSHQIFFSRQMLLGVGFGLAISLTFNFVTAVDSLVGNRQLLWYMIGRYHRPVHEERVFMFLDLKDSTEIAERIGDDIYLRFLDDFLIDVGLAIHRCRGQVYKYIGDEVVVSWLPGDAVQDRNCLKCFFEARHAVEARGDDYLAKYGVIPDFRAAIHAGEVVTGEVGLLKKEIAFVGDVINTTARLAEACKAHSTHLLASGPVLKMITNADGFVLKRLGLERLRGKEEELEVFSVDSAEASSSMRSGSSSTAPEA